MENKMIMVAIILFAIGFIVLSYCIGYIKGFKKMKEIDDKIIEELKSKYSV
jgi:hypothetical protein